MGPNFFELINNSIVNFEKSCLRKIEFQRNFLVEIRQSIMKLLSFKLTFENVKWSIQGFFNFKAGWLFENVISEIGSFDYLSWYFLP